MEPFNAERIEAQVTADRALSVALREIGRLARVVEEQSGRIESLEGANVKRDSETEPDAEPPYRMAEPTNFGAAVIDDRVIWIRDINGYWRSGVYVYTLDWCDLDDPHPYQNCVLTADDPEPPVGSVVRGPAGLVSERGAECWNSPWYTNAPTTWAEVADGSVTLLYRGEA